MHFGLVFATSLLLSASSLPFTAQADSHIRSLDDGLAKTISEGINRSPTFAHIVDGLEQSNVVVYVGFDNQLLTNVGGRTTLITASGKWRYLRVVIRRRLSDFQQIAMVAHELHHALEIASSPEVHDLGSLADLYRAIGEPLECPSECYETLGAVEAAGEVERELRKPSRWHPSPSSIAHASQSRGQFVASKK